MNVWILWEACEGDWSTIYGVFLSPEEAEAARKDLLPAALAEVATIIQVRVGEVEPDGWR